MKAETLDEEISNIIKDENPTAEAVNALIKVNKEEGSDTSDIELKTDLTEDEVKIHSVLAVVNNALLMEKKDFSTKCILGELITRKERKSLSKERKSRGEIVEVARRPDMPFVSGMGGGDMQARQGFMKRMFTPRR